MDVIIEKSKPSGKIKSPKSKSQMHRLLIASSLCDGVSTISGIERNDDVEATVGCLKKFNADISTDYERGIITVRGFNPMQRGKCEVFCNESGSTLRFLIPIAALSPYECIFDGKDRLLERSMAIYDELGLIKRNDKKIYVTKTLSPANYIIKGDISSQFITGLLFALPILPGNSTIKVKKPFESRSYVDMTIDVMEKFGVKIVEAEEDFFFIKGGQKYIGADTKVEGDMSGIAFFEALNTMYGDVEVSEVPDNSLQGDKVLYDCFEKIKNGTPTLSVANCPDLAPILMALASFFNGCVLTDTKRLKDKECDRGVAMKEELEKVGGKVYLEENSITVKKAVLKAPVESIESHNDHRIVMAMAVLLTFVGGKIKQAEAVNKSMPNFFSKLEALKVKLLYEFNK